MTNLGATGWYVVRTHARQEVKAAVNLERQGYRTYLPRYLRRRQHARRVEIIPAPLFTCYLFVAIDIASQRWRSIQSTYGVVQLVCNGANPALVPPAIVADFRNRENEQGFVQLAQRGLTKGEQVRVVEGVFSPGLGLFEGMTDNERVTVLLDLLGRKVRISMEQTAVAAL